MPTPRWKIRSALAALLLACGGAQADIAADWKAIALQTVLQSAPDPAQAACALATVHVAMREITSFVEGGAPRVLVRPPAPLGRSGAAASAAGAHHVLAQIYPARKAALDRALERSLAAVPDEREKSNARIWGRQLAEVIQAGRAPDRLQPQEEAAMSSPRFAIVLCGLALSLAASAQADTPLNERNRPMAKYVIERDLPGAGKLSAAQLRDISRKSREVLQSMGPKIQWVQSYVTEDKIYCVYIAEDEAAIRKHAQAGGFPAGRISRIATTIDPVTAE
jgi:hypothetical protein